MRSILHRSFNVLQWEALVLLVAGITVNQLNYCTKDSAGAVFTTHARPYAVRSVQSSLESLSFAHVGDHAQSQLSLSRKQSWPSPQSRTSFQTYTSG